MIVDNIKNIKLYSDIPPIAADFIVSLHDSNITLGKHILTDKIYANIEEYSTKLLTDAKFESHDNYIDIQLLISGHEKIAIADREKLTISEPYDKNRDITFYSESVKSYQNIILEGTNFVMIFPHEGHAPQISLNEEAQKVLKVVVKIKV